MLGAISAVSVWTTQTGFWAKVNFKKKKLRAGQVQWITKLCQVPVPQNAAAASAVRFPASELCNLEYTSERGAAMTRILTTSGMLGENGL
ncbi:hypothetical protein BaRGS_00036443 [Batillaria attramentaria]|uniref:Uncharacterized protein n=1 Tax=Batillaria attramentaria TaxID=370345 RepID=A0ABD0JD26_9CAEN